MTNQQSTSTTGDGSMLWEGDGSNSYQLPWLQNGSDTWFRMRVLFPDGTNAAYPGKFTLSPLGGWDTIQSWHSAPGAGYSTVVGVHPDTGGVPVLMFRPVGGDVSGQTFTYVYQTDGTGQRIRLKYNHWYDIVVHLKFGTTSSTGLAEWWVDGIGQYSGQVPTITTTVTGTTPGVGHEVGLYRGPSRSDTDTLYIDGVVTGPTVTSIGG
ncbi:MAG: heparin lyase I family protein [Gaiellaceae bacterium]